MAYIKEQGILWCQNNYVWIRKQSNFHSAKEKMEKVTSSQQVTFTIENIEMGVTYRI